MSVRCRVQCIHNLPFEGLDDGRAVVEFRLMPAESSSDNASIFAGEPDGVLQLVGVSKSIAERYVEGQEYAVDISQPRDPTGAT